VAKIWLVWAAVALGASVQPGEQNATQTTRRVLRLAGQTSARRYYNITAPMVTGGENRPLELTYLAKAGAAVKRGQLIAQLDAQSTADHVEDVADEVKQAKADMVRRKAEQDIEWETLQQSLRQAKSDAEKAKIDARQAGILTDIERELLRLNVEETDARYRKLLETVKLQRASFDAEMRILDLTRERQQRHHDRHAHDLALFTMKAPMDGLAVMQSIWRGGEFGQAQQGDQISPGQLFMKVVDVQSMQLEARANQAESSLLRIGQKVSVRLDAFPGVLLPGHVYSIGALAVSNGGQSYYIRNIAVNVAIEGSDPKLIPDLSASGDVLVGQN
jgi:HlyD family secretion protein